MAFVPNPEHRLDGWRVSLDDIVEVVAKNTGCRADAIRGVRRVGDVVLPRALVMYLACQTNRYSLPAIGKLFKRHHTTVLAGRDKVTRLLQEDPALGHKVSAMVADLRARGELVAENEVKQVVRSRARKTTAAQDSSVVDTARINRIVLHSGEQLTVEVGTVRLKSLAGLQLVWFRGKRCEADTPNTEHAIALQEIAALQFVPDPDS